MDKRIRALIAEDDALVGDAVQRQLEKIGVEVIGRAADGRQVIELAQSLHPDVVLMDIEMPEMDGLDATQQIQAQCPAPVVLLTAHDDPELVARAGQVGAGAYLVKPPNAREMDRAITIAMARFADMLELRRLNIELAAYDRSVAHDLKGPLGMIYTAAYLLVQDYSALPPEQLRQLLQDILISTHRANTIIESLLLLAQPGEVPCEPLDMATLIATAQKGLAPLIEKSDAEIIVPSTWPKALGQPALVERVWDNYMSNAIKYGGRPPRLEFGGEVLPDGMARFWVQDNGNGIPTQTRAKLFTAFTRLESGEVKGHGLGLYLARRIVEKLGGQVGVESDGVPGHGSLFYFTLPAAPRNDER